MHQSRRNHTAGTARSNGSSPAGSGGSGGSGGSVRATLRSESARGAADNALSFAQQQARGDTRRQAIASKPKAPASATTPAPASNQWVLPTSGFHISVWFGEAGPYWSSGYHTGIDFAAAYGTPVVAVADATVAKTGWDGAYGNQIRLQFENGDQVWYNHLSAIEVSPGISVLEGQELGRIGETGNAYGAHLHFEYRLATDLTTAVDPLPFFEAHGVHLS